ncbi:hypothetical protein CO046_04715 [Candidatus Peregrinibacteria bacterium CG_4_9_14_0_2_um_filter_53_11]|nr:MAG: hypothetical protein CO046_04715 [Candidatus Peregrinibacteria bacterium CG_4_9_14_0_2_um_filter_53_11]
MHRLSLSRGHLIFFCLIIGLYLLRYYAALPNAEERAVQRYQGSVIQIQGMIVEEPIPTGSGVRARFLIERIALSTRWWPNTSELTLRTDGLKDLAYGDRIEIRGRLDPPSEYDHPRVVGGVQTSSIKLLERGGGSAIRRALISTKNILIGRLNKVFQEPYGSLAAGFLLGARSSIPQSIIEDFRRTGLTHILALSGFNIVIIINVITSLLRPLPRTAAGLSALAGITLFTLLVGAGASIVRAALMGSLGIVGGLLRRPVRSARMLYIAGYLMILHDPFILMHDIGFQLSFCATAGIIYFNKRIEEHLSFIPERFALRETVTTTWSAQLLTLPLLLYYFHALSLIGTAVNIFVLPLIPLTMLGATLALMGGSLFAAPTALLMRLMLWIVGVGAAVPYGYLDFS